MYKGQINERYYARDNTPSFYQFKQRYHFYDEQGRQYMIVTKNRQVLQNMRFKSTRLSSTTTQEPVMNNYDQAKLYVKLSEPMTPWFGYKDVGKRLVLIERGGDGMLRSFTVELKSYEKNSASRRVGSIYVKGLDRATLTEILNRNQ